LSTSVAVVTATASALVLGLSAVADQRSTKQVKTRRALSPRIIEDLIRQPLWLIAIAANIVGFALQVVALNFGSIALVQPIVACDLMFAVLIGRYVWRSPNMRPAKAGRLLAGVAATTLGVAGFIAIGQPSAGTTQARLDILPPLAIGLVVVVGACLAVAARSRTLQPLALALACGVNYGIAAFLVKLLTSQFGGGLAEVFTSWPIYLFLVVGPAGYILNQNAYQQGTLLAPVQAIISAADPILSIALGILWLDVQLRGGPAATAGEVVSLLLLTAGIVVTAYHAPAPMSAQLSEHAPESQSSS
jgi:drug/metabolite transporter (DMT)-like permease